MGEGSFATNEPMAPVRRVVNPTRADLTMLTRSMMGSEMASAISCCHGHKRMGPGTALRSEGSLTVASSHSLRGRRSGGVNLANVRLTQGDHHGALSDPRRVKASRKCLSTTVRSKALKCGNSLWMRAGVASTASRVIVTIVAHVLSTLAAETNLLRAI